MKIWKWYRNYSDKDLREIRDLSIDEKYPLYAITNNKKYRDIFRLTRKKQCFIEKSEEIDEDEWVDIANKNNAYVLGIYSYSHFVRRVSLHEEMEDRDFVSTWEEKENVTLNTEFDSIPVNFPLFTDMDPYPLDDKIIRALEKLEFFSIWKFLSELGKEKVEGVLESLELELDYSDPNIVPDEFNWFIAIYQDVLAIDDSEAMI